MKTLRKVLIGMYGNIGYVLAGIVMMNVFSYVLGFANSFDDVFGAVFSTFLVIIVIVVVAFIAVMFTKDDELKEIEKKFNS